MKQNSTMFNTISNSLKEQIRSQGKTTFTIKILVFMSLYTFLVLNSLHDLCNPGHVPECIRDEMHEKTRPIAKFLMENQLYRNILIIFSSILMDFNVIVLSVRWFLLERNFKLLMIVFTFYLFRSFMQQMFFMKFPDDYVWGYPGLFSLSVAYAPANDFFFSGLCGMCTIAFIHFRRNGQRTLSKIAFFTIIYEFFTLLVTRSHYFIDLAIGIIVAHYIYLIFDWIEEYYNKRELNKLKYGPIAHVTKAEEIIHNVKESKLRQNVKDEEKARKS